MCPSPSQGALAQLQKGPGTWVVEARLCQQLTSLHGHLSVLQANLTKSQNGFKIVLKELEDSLLARLSAASGDFLGDTALVENLETTKHTASEIKEKVRGCLPWLGHTSVPGGPGQQEARGSLPRAPGTAAKGAQRHGTAHVHPGLLSLLSFALRCKKQESQKSKSTRPERTTGPLQRGQPCSTSS